jgi:hypothetical protein
MEQQGPAEIAAPKYNSQDIEVRDTESTTGEELPYETQIELVKAAGGEGSSLNAEILEAKLNLYEITEPNSNSKTVLNYTTSSVIDSGCVPCGHNLLRTYESAIDHAGKANQITALAAFEIALKTQGIDPEEFGRRCRDKALGI